MVTDSFTGYLSTQQFARAAVKCGDDYPARRFASAVNYRFRLDAGRIYLAQKKVGAVAPDSPLFDLRGLLLAMINLAQSKPEEKKICESGSPPYILTPAFPDDSGEHAKLWL